MQPIVVRVDPDLEELIPDFLENRRRDVDSLLTSVDSGRLDEAVRLGHTLKGVGGGFGFDAITDLGRAIEDAAQRKRPAEIRSLAEQLRSYLERVEVIYDV